ncbi:MAG: hypothetical protein Q4B26_03120 [Eubacteriales bacterium]|nr:hypothetical protein [Eubacteriales bacterium]
MKNKDIPILAMVLPAMAMLEQIDEQIEWQRSKMVNVSQKISDMPRGGSGGGGIDRDIAILTDLEEEQKRLCREYALIAKKAQRILARIESLSMRSFVSMKYIMDYSDTEIRRKLNLSRRGMERAKKCCEEAPEMAMVKWRERYIVSSDNTDKNGKE